ncbi:Shikimate O-hydroxycinnamoyltransferase [Hibiscus syriacus]|uniref:Shikimate O-hydroxycinnamoyltransferase n=1 Tax=Hibiscus syriacus TaxID=106335 RepID=A0A6A3CTI0_HIBSY|nr:shikimate O-hydroxycinnamoyltransferase-like [Hibiscus syriacus]XP_039007970.1 shikimate O-hydroxycinnamoyltransferase-like [Hibiscus syriacus]KAE8732590.1 Shikimate O-hydroxycinnamoyltransferase [Hibiscus syriacus]
MEFAIKESSIVYPAEETPKHRLWSSNLELLMTLHHVPIVYFFRPIGSSDFFDTRLLKESLSKVLVPFYPMAGRLGRDENGRIEIVCNGEGALFIEAETEYVIDDLIGDTMNHSPDLWRLVPKVDYSVDISSYPLILTQVTRFKCGGVGLGIGLQHTLADGPASIHFINSWAEMARGLPLSVQPYIDRSLLQARVPPTPTFHHVEYDPPLSINTAEEPQWEPETTVSIFKLTPDQLNTLKTNANRNGDGGVYSTYNSLAAHIWRCINKARCLPDDQATKLHIPIDGRSRLRPLPPGYLGNVIFMSATIASHGEIQSESFSCTAKRIKDILKRMDDEYLRSAIDYMEKVPNVKAPVRGARGFQCPNLSINSWMWLPLYDADFGWGRPIWLGPAKVSQDGKTYILPSPTNDGSLSVVSCLDTSHMKNFGQLLYEI